MILRSFYNGACSIASKHDSDDQFFLLATVRNMKKKCNLYSYIGLLILK
jgi:hypothetical protein